MNDTHRQAAAEYSAPEIRTVSDEELLETIGPAQAYTGQFPFGF